MISRLGQPTKVINRSQAGPEDSQGTPTWVDADPVVESWHVQPRTSDDLYARPASKATHRGFGPFDTVADHKSKLVWSGRVFEVDGEPRVWVNPRTGSPHHCEVDLVRWAE